MDLRLLILGSFGLTALACSDSRAALRVDPARVLSTTQRTTNALVTVRTDAETIVATPEHPFARVGSGWTPAGALRVGDQIHSPRGTTRVAEVTFQRVRSTPVYNLTIAKTHSYFVGHGALLVHNVDCAGSGASDTQTERERELQQGAERHREAVERDAQELRLRRLVDGHRRRMNRLNVNDSQGAVAAGNCTSCALTMLNDVPGVQEFARKYQFDEGMTRSSLDLDRVLIRLGLTRLAAQVPRTYSNSQLDRLLQRMVGARKRPQRNIARRFGDQYPESRAREYIAGLPGNTSLIAFNYVTREEVPPGSGHFEVKSPGHAIVAVRMDDGEIVYIDPQNVPPRVYRWLPPVASTVTVYPTDVDWHYNRQIFAALRDGNVSDSYD